MQHLLVKLNVYVLLFQMGINPSTCQTQPPSPFHKMESVAEKYSRLSIGEIRPAGWLNSQINENMKGFTGYLDSLAPDLIINDDIYGKNRLSKNIKSKDLGAQGVEGDWQVQFLWWNSETQSNWWDGVIRSAILTDNKVYLEKVKTYVKRILSTQDSDGYLGIYDQELRYRFDDENGELWSKASLLRGMLAWFEYTNSEDVLNSVERSVNNIMDNFPVNNSHPFYSKNPNVGGVTHGLAITDVFENLYRITGKEIYRDYCLFLYKDFSLQILNEDAQYSKLVSDTALLKGHSVHTYEHLRSLAAAYYASGNTELNKAIQQFLKKMDAETTASGAAIGDEWISGKKADATMRGYEYCSLHELMHSYLELFIKSGECFYADRAEQIFLNPAQGARHPSGKSITYLKSDNSYFLTGGLNGDTSDPNQTRYRYSPTHKEAAVCCVPNAGRIAPYYVQSMWLKTDNSLVNALLGPSEVRTKINGKSVTVKELTDYPYGYSLRFTVATVKNHFALKIRKPAWVNKISVSEKYSEADGYIIIEKVWNGEHHIRIDFFPDVVLHTDINNEAYFSYGALILALPIAGVQTQYKSYPVKGFYDFNYTPEKLVVYRYAGQPVTQDRHDLAFKTILLNPVTNSMDSVRLIPMARTILRQVTFKNGLK